MQIERRAYGFTSTRFDGYNDPEVRSAIQKLNGWCDICDGQRASGKKVAVVFAGKAYCASCRPATGPAARSVAARRPAGPIQPVSTPRRRAPLSPPDAIRLARLEAARIALRADTRRAAPRTDADRVAALRQVARSAGVRL